VGDRSDREFCEIRVATADWPIVLVEFPENRVPDTALHAVLGRIEELFHEALRTDEKLFFITDLTRMREIAPASQRRYTGEWAKRTLPLAKKAGAGGATVTPSAILRGIITAVYWVQPPPTPAFSVGTRHEAMLKGIELLESQKVSLPPRLIAYRDGREEPRAPTSRASLKG
jgi:hypothetical protein